VVSPTPFSPTLRGSRLVAPLAREVEALRRVLDQLRGLPGRVEELADLVACLADATPEQPALEASRVTWSWLNLPDATQQGPEIDGVVEETNTPLTELVAWLGRVYLRYADAARTLPACWLWHPEVVEELVWLRATPSVHARFLECPAAPARTRSTACAVGPLREFPDPRRADRRAHSRVVGRLFVQRRHRAPT
jgi:hypothetical protein